jgi:hypothetical protein
MDRWLDDDDLDDDDLDDRDDLDKFRDGFQVSRKGNLWRTWRGRTLTVFRRADGDWAWCIHDGKAARYSGAFADEAEAFDDLWEAVGQ